MRFVLVVAALILFAAAAKAEKVKIPWKGDYAHNSEDNYSPENKYKSGRSKSFSNGAPEEGGRIQRDGFLEAELMKPRGVSGAVPYVILMHGCSGLSPPVVRWAREKAQLFLDQGYGVLILDSFRTRNVKEVCGSANYHWGWRRAEDAYSALDYLIDRKLAKPDDVFVMGRSNGGTAAVMIADASQVRGHPNRFAAIFAVSPGCAGLTKSRAGIPLVMFVGEKDNANDPKVCKEIDTASNAPVQIVEFKGMYHGYEDKGPAYTFHGWHMEHNAGADKETMDRALALIKSRNFQRGIEYR
ncbi:MAG: prolyl oligopeptidase family serine peptidase [Rhizobiales bacterium]|nr:prolyl oligopeptidase family serine peptidase [Hyphomicrobiales bacterium]